MSEHFQIPRGLPIQPVKPQGTPGVGRPSKNDGAFAKILDDKLKSVKFSAHANKRLQARKIELDEGQLNRLEDAVDKARTKGGRETLILLDNVAMVVSVSNRTVITVMDGENLKDNVFTQIDSAVIT
ncbi:MAG: TIGR02530 family flagellar biosynthesis protein [Bacillota bacterium]|nr:TIGR02530 family flagellar biosynthesis protein [Bacillota bacterium]